jgi:NAD-dependent dihydropyrimidine dehydrogenase PreA subunit
MAYVITEPCINSKNAACLDVCPVDCIHPMKDEKGFKKTPQLYINPDECIDCGACREICPSKAIFAEKEVPRKWEKYIQVNRDYFNLD